MEHLDPISIGHRLETISQHIGDIVNRTKLPGQHLNHNDIIDLANILTSIQMEVALLVRHAEAPSSEALDEILEGLVTGLTQVEQDLQQEAMSLDSLDGETGKSKAVSSLQNILDTLLQQQTRLSELIGKVLPLDGQPSSQETASKLANVIAQLRGVLNTLGGNGNLVDVSAMLQSLANQTREVKVDVALLTTGSLPKAMAVELEGMTNVLAQHFEILHSAQDGKVRDVATEISMLLEYIKKLQKRILNTAGKYDGYEDHLSPSVIAGQLQVSVGLASQLTQLILAMDTVPESFHAGFRQFKETLMFLQVEIAFLYELPRPMETSTTVTLSTTVAEDARLAGTPAPKASVHPQDPRSIVDGLLDGSDAIRELSGHVDNASKLTQGLQSVSAKLKDLNAATNSLGDMLLPISGRLGPSEINAELLAVDSDIDRLLLEAPASEEMDKALETVAENLRKLAIEVSLLLPEGRPQYIALHLQDLVSRLDIHMHYLLAADSDETREANKLSVLQLLKDFKQIGYALDALDGLYQTSSDSLYIPNIKNELQNAIIATSQLVEDIEGGLLDSDSASIATLLVKTLFRYVQAEISLAKLKSPHEAAGETSVKRSPFYDFVITIFGLLKDLETSMSALGEQHNASVPEGLLGTIQTILDLLANVEARLLHFDGRVSSLAGQATFYECSEDIKKLETMLVKITENSDTLDRQDLLQSLQSGYENLGQLATEFALLVTDHPQITLSARLAAIAAGVKLEMNDLFSVSGMVERLSIVAQIQSRVSEIRGLESLLGEMESAFIGKSGLRNVNELRLGLKEVAKSILELTSNSLETDGGDMTSLSQDAIMDTLLHLQIETALLAASEDLGTESSTTESHASSELGGIYLNRILLAKAEIDRAIDLITGVIETPVTLKSGDEVTNDIDAALVALLNGQSQLASLAATKEGDSHSSALLGGAVADLAIIRREIGQAPVHATVGGLESILELLERLSNLLGNTMDNHSPEKFSSQDPSSAELGRHVQQLSEAIRDSVSKLVEGDSNRVMGIISELLENVTTLGKLENNLSAMQQSHEAQPGHLGIEDLIPSLAELKTAFETVLNDILTHDITAQNEMTLSLLISKLEFFAGEISALREISALVAPKNFTGSSHEAVVCASLEFLFLRESDLLRELNEAPETAVLSKLEEELKQAIATAQKIESELSEGDSGLRTKLRTARISVAKLADAYHLMQEEVVQGLPQQQKIRETRYKIVELLA